MSTEPPAPHWVRTVAAATGLVVLAAVALYASDPSVALPPRATPAPQPVRVNAEQASPLPTTTIPVSVALDPSVFADGACVAFAPIGADQHRTVFIDAGHGGPDPGGAGSTSAGDQVFEKQLTLPVALAAAQQLRAAGYRVVLSRTTDTSVSRPGPGDLNGSLFSTQGEHSELLARAHCANLAQASALVSIHFDTYPDASVQGATTLYDADRTFAPANLSLAALVQRDVLAALAAGGWQVPDRGVITDTSAGGGEITAQGNAYGHLIVLGPASPGYVDEPSTMPGALTEPLFITNPTEADLADSAAGQQAVATGIATAVGEFLRSAA